MTSRESRALLHPSSLVAADTTKKKKGAGPYVDVDPFHQRPKSPVQSFALLLWRKPEDKLKDTTVGSMKFSKYVDNAAFGSILSKPSANVTYIIYSKQGDTSVKEALVSQVDVQTVTKLALHYICGRREQREGLEVMKFEDGPRTSSLFCDKFSIKGSKATVFKQVVEDFEDYESHALLISTTTTSPKRAIEHDVYLEPGV